DRTAKAVGGDLNGTDRGEYPLLPALADAGLPRQQRCDILIAGFGRGQCKDAKTEAEERETRALRPVTQLQHRNAHATHTHAIELQYIRAIRSFLLLSNLGCEGVNRRCTAAPRKDRLGLRPRYRNPW